MKLVRRTITREYEDRGRRIIHTKVLENQQLVYFSGVDRAKDWDKQEEVWQTYLPEQNIIRRLAKRAVKKYAKALRWLGVQK